MHNSWHVVVLVFTALMVGGGALTQGQQGRQANRQVTYEYFDDYLLSIMGPPGRDATSTRHVATPSSDGQNVEEEGDVAEEQGASTDADSSVDIIGYFRDVPREHWSCCMLGKLAGDKGFHCHARFYASRIVLRNENRAHNRKMLFHGSDRVPNWGLSIMRTFQRCIARHADEFHKCCYAATEEKREIHRWHRFRQMMGQAHGEN